MKKTVLKYLSMMILSVFLFVGCEINGKSRYSVEYFTMFDTVTQIIIYAQNNEVFKEQSTVIYNELSRLHKLFDIYNSYDGINNLKTVNDSAGVAPVVVGSEILDLLLLSKKIYDDTKGAVNVAMGSVLSIWHDYRIAGIDNPNEAKLPSIEELEQASKYTNMDDISIDIKNSTVFLRDSNISLDVGAIAKGYSVQRASEVAKSAHVSSGLISLGGNVLTIGAKYVNNKKQEPWKVGVQNPQENNQNEVLFSVDLNDSSLVTSGNYQRTYTVNGKKYHHIIHPKTLFPAEYFSSVTVLCKDSGRADALSTALYNMPYNEGIELINSGKLGNDVQVAWIFADNSIKYTDGWI